MSTEPAAKKARVEPASITIVCADDARVILPLELATQCNVLANLIEDTGQGDAEVPTKNMSAASVQALAALLRGGAIPEDFAVVGDAIRAANFFDAGVVLDALLKHVFETAKAAAAVPSPNPYALMFGMEDSGSLTIQVRDLLQGVRDVEPALAERITRAICGGGAVDWSSPAAAYATAAGDARLKTTAAKIAGGEIALAMNGTAKTVNGLEVGCLELASEIEKCSFDHGAFSGKIDSIISFESVTSEEQHAHPQPESMDELGLPKFRSITLRAICSLTTAAGATTCEVTMKAGMPAPGWSLQGLPDGCSNNLDDYFSHHPCTRAGKTPADFPFVELVVKLNDGQLSEGEQRALQAPGDLKATLHAAFQEVYEGADETPEADLLLERIDDDDDDDVGHLDEKQHPLFAALWRPVLAHLWYT